MQKCSKPDKEFLENIEFVILFLIFGVIYTVRIDVDFL